MGAPVLFIGGKTNIGEDYYEISVKTFQNVIYIDVNCALHIACY